MQKAALGRMVHVFVDPGLNNGADVAAAFITRVWSDETVNLKVLVDGDSVPLRLNSVRLVAERPPAEALAEDTTPFICFWPPRV